MIKNTATNKCLAKIRIDWPIQTLFQLVSKKVIDFPVKIVARVGTDVVAGKGMGLWEVQEKFDSSLPVNKPILFITKDEIDFSNGSPRALDLLVTNENLKTTDILDPIVN